MRAAVISEPGKVTVEETGRLEPGPGEVQIRVGASGICGTDIHIYRGEYLGGYPVIPGHEFAGEVTAVGAGTGRISLGDRVAVEPNIACDNCRNCLANRQNFCLNWKAVGVTRPGAMAEYVTVPEKAVFPIGGLPFSVAAFVEPLSCVLHGIGKARISPADRVAVLGGGPIGMLLLQTARLQGTREAVVVERSDSRRATARKTGADEVYASSGELEDSSCDVVIDASGAFSLMRDAVRIARRGGTILYFGVPPAGKEMAIEPFDLFRKGLTICASFTSVRNSFQAVELLASGRIDAAGLVSHTLGLDRFEEGMLMIEEGRDGVMKVLIDPGL